MASFILKAIHDFQISVHCLCSTTSEVVASYDEITRVDIAVNTVMCLTYAM